MCTQLLAPLLSVELHDAVRVLSRDRCSGEVGLLPFFFLEILGRTGKGVAACLTGGDGHELCTS